MTTAQEWLLQNQLYTSLVCAVLLLGLVLYRLLHTVSSALVSSLLPHLLASDDPLQQWKQQWVIGRAAGLLCTIVLLVLRLLVSLWTAMCTLFLALLPVLALSLVLVLLEARAASSLLWLHDAMNSSVVTTLWQGIMAGLQALDTVSANVLPTYNFVVYALFRLPVDLLQWLWFSPGVHASVALFVREVGAACAALPPSVMGFLRANFRSECMRMASLQVCEASAGALCVDTGAFAATQASCLQDADARTVPFATDVFPHLRAASVAVVGLLDEACSVAAPLLHVLLYPLRDADAWQALDRFLNAVLYLLVGVPSTTVQRCALAPQRASMCTPDAFPVVRMAAEGTQHLSAALNNWADHAYAALLGISMDGPDAAAALQPFWNASSSFFGVNRTAWVTLTSSSAAVSDGVHTLWVSTQGQVAWRYAIDNWPFAVDVRLGLAAVHLASGSEGILGCSCTGQMKLACALAGADDTWTLPVYWALPDDVNYLSCDRVRVVVQSLRWPARRVSAGGAVPNGRSCLESGTCEVADAVVYVIPVCGAEGGPAFLACTSAFTRVSCFPYCMALRMRGGGPFALVMRGAAEWQSGVLLAGVDCAPNLVQAADVASGLSMQVVCSSSATPVELDGAALLQLAFQEQNTDACAFDATCVTFLQNRSLLSRYDAAPWISGHPAASTTVDIMMQGQPLVVAGSVQLRGFTRGAEVWADFPQLVVDQRNEFSMEVGLGVGVPGSTLATPSQQDRELLPPGTLWLPPAVLEGITRTYNPATQTPDGAMWYAVNPFYDDSLECLARLCGAPELAPCIQIAMGSSYERMSVWRVRTGQGVCYAGPDGARQCAPDVAAFTFVDKARDIMRVTEQGGQGHLVQDCYRGTQFNLYVESLEYFDDLNVLVAVRRGTLADLHRLLWGGGGGGRTVFYFVNAANLTLVQEGRPWTLPGILPPQLRFLPRVGDVVGFGMEAALRLLQVPANLAMNPFALLELLRAWPRFPQNTLYHGALAQCGEVPCLASLDGFFLAAHNANDAAWGVVAWVVGLLHVPTEVDRGLLQSFLMGSVTMGEASHHLQLFGVVSTGEELFDTGLESTLLPGGRRLLGWKSKVAKGTLSTIGTTLSTSVQGIFSLSKNLVQLNLGAGADFGVLLASQDPTFMLGSHMSSFPVAWSQFTYQLLVPLVMDVLSGVMGGGATAGGLLNRVFVRAYQAQDNFEWVVQAEARQGCMGLRGMTGGPGSSLGRALYYNCLSAVDIGTATYILMNLFTVDALLYRCMCVLPGPNVDFAQYVRDVCVPSAPSSKKAELLALLLTREVRSDQVQLVCQRYVQAIEDRALTLFDPWTTSSASSAAALGDVLSDLVLSSSAGCSSAATNPYSIAMAPLPIEHFRVCGNTTMCRLRCVDALAVFEAERARSGGALQVFDLLQPPEVESPFFPMFAVTDATALVGLRTVWALSAQPMRLCACANMAYCVSVAGVSLRDGETFEVKGFCLPRPQDLRATVQRAEQWPAWTVPGLDPTTLRYVEFWNIPEVEQQTYLLVGEQVELLVGSQSHTRQTLTAWWPGATQGATVLDSDQIASRALSTSILQKLHPEDDLSSQGLEVTSVSIQTVIPIAAPRVLVLFLEVQLSYRAVQLSGSQQEVVDSVILHAVAQWCNPALPSCPLSAPRTRYYLPCEQDSHSCQKGLDDALKLGRAGTLMLVPSTHDYWWLPSFTLSAAAGSSLQRWTIEPDATAVRNASLKLSSSHTERSKLGVWTQSSVFDGPTRDVVRSPVAHNASSDLFWLQYESTGSLWLKEYRPTSRGGVYQLESFASMTTTPSVSLNSQCSAMSCAGCATPTVRLLCHSAQDCLLSRCVGTMVNTQSVLCGAGSVMEAMYLHMCASWRAMYLFVVEIAFYVMRGISGEKLTQVVLQFPTARFYELVCTTKDLFASYAGLGVSVLQTLQAWLTTGQLKLNQGFDVVSEGEVVSAYQYNSLGQALFGVVTATTLHPILAMHRWLLCVANVQSEEAMLGVSVQIVFGDVHMDQSWAACESLPSVVKLLQEDMRGVQSAIQDLTENMAGTALTLVSGVSEAVIYLLKLQFDAFCTILLSVVWAVQNMMLAFHVKECKVPDYAQTYALNCTCQDTPHVVPSPQRAQKFADGALWCTGSLSVPLVTGEMGVIYNPFSLQELGEYLGPSAAACMRDRASANHGDWSVPATCSLEQSGASALSALVAQHVQPIDVWARCKSNYLLRQWDVGAGAVFMEEAAMDAVTGLSVEVREHQPAAVRWARDNGILECMRAQGRFNVDYGACMNLYLQQTTHHTLAWYYTYKVAPATAVPDACLVFSGLNRSQDPALGAQLRACGNLSGACFLNPLLWSSSAPHLATVTAQHGSADPSTADIQEQYRALRAKVQGYFADFNRSWEKESQFIEATFFSADGDLVHDFMDCVFLGPYTRADWLPCAVDDARCPFYARDDLGGLSRNFSEGCMSDSQTDFDPPFTCGSPARRSIIKYFFRNVTKLVDSTSMNKNVTSLLRNLTLQLEADYTDTSHYGCRDAATGACSAAACFATPNSYTPCLSSVRTITSAAVEQFVATTLLPQLQGYYRQVLQDTAPFTAYFGAARPAQWGREERRLALEQGLWAPGAPLVAYGADDELYNLPLAGATPEEREGGSLWGLCAALVGRPMMSLPLQQFQDGAWRPADASTLLQRGDPQSWAALPALVRSLVDDSMQRGALHWHRARRHVPSVSRVCTEPLAHPRQTQAQRVSMHVSDPAVGDFVVRELPVESQQLPLFGFQWGAIGDAEQYCPCGWLLPAFQTCALDAAACAPPVASPCLQALCNATGREYLPSDADAVEDCLASAGAGVRCTEMGPSDLWGLFPADCGGAECAAAAQWGQSHFPSRMTWEGIRLLSEARAGWKLPSFESVNATFHATLHHGQRARPVRDFRQPACRTDEQLQADPPADVRDAEELVRHLFPAAQLLHESPAVADCTRYLVEVARVHALAYVSAAESEGAGVHLRRWEQRCHAQTSQLSACAFLGIYFEVEPPDSARSCGAIRVADADFGKVYLTPDCVAVDRPTRRMYDAHRCLKTAAVLQRVHLLDACALAPQPLALVDGAGLTRLSLATRLADAALADLLLPDEDFLDLVARDPQVSEVLDWWPDADALPPVGYHVTAASVLDELAPMLFDNHWAYDTAEQYAFYVHTALRSERDLHRTVGATGLCRRHSVGMPLFDADTCRACTRARRREGDPDAPQAPVAAPRDAPGQTWLLDTGYTPDFMDRLFFDEQCAASSEDVPWEPLEHDRQTWAVGALPGWHALMQTDASGVVTLAAGAPVQLALPAALASWGDNCSRSVQWGTLPACNASVQQRQQCEAGSACLPLRRDGTEGVCYPVAQDARTRAPCFAGHHCQDGLVCLADGACGGLHLHVWNQNGFDLEVATLADDCGLVETLPPYVQTTLGASPWEWVPDFLLVHGFCAHHRWFTYQTGLNETDTCRRPAEGGAVCNASGAWPWAYSYPDGTSAPVATKAVLGGNVQRVVPHTCDAAFMHLGAPSGGGRLKLCSAARDNSGTARGAQVRHYRLDDDSGASWVQPPNVSRWLRTTDAEGNSLLLATAGETSGPLGFLGGLEGSPAPIVDLLGQNRDKVRFFRCKEKLACEPPPFQYNGLTRPRVGLFTQTNRSELSLRRCGPMGQLWPRDTAARAAACLLDQPLFPVVSQAIWNQDRDSCRRLWPDPLLLQVTKVRGVPTDAPEATLGEREVRCYAPVDGRECPNVQWDGLLCQCLYLARVSGVLTDASAQDAVASLGDRLNAVFTNMQVPDLPSLTERYEATMLCFASLAGYAAQLHSASGYQQWYESAQPAGLYVAFRLSLYEVPLPWMLDAALAALLPAGLIQPPPLSLGLKGTHNQFGRLQSGDGWKVFCDPNTLSGRPQLAWLWCGDGLPQQPVLMGQQTASIERLMDEVHTNLTNTFGRENPNLQVVCYQEAHWRCENASYVNASTAKACKAARAALNLRSTDCNKLCNDEPFGTLFEDPCTRPSQYFLSASAEVTDLATLAPGLALDNLNFGQYLTQVQVQLLASAEHSIVPNDYAQEVLQKAGKPGVVNVWPVELDAGLVASSLAVEDFFATTCQLSMNGFRYDMCPLIDEPPLFDESDSCVLPEDEDVFAYYEEGTTTSVTAYTDEGGVEGHELLNMCPSWDNSAKCFLQPNATESTSEKGIGRIQVVRAPPGVNVALFGWLKPPFSMEWTQGASLCMQKYDANAGSFCTWNLPVDPNTAPTDNSDALYLANGWDGDADKVNTLGAKVNRSRPLTLSWADVDNYMLSHASAHWLQSGCGAGRFAAPNGVGIKVQSNMACSLPSENAKPSVACPDGERWFVVGKGTGYWLWRCSPCTRYKQKVPAYNDFPRVGCHFAGQNTSATDFTQSNVDYALQGMGSPERVQALLGAPAVPLEATNCTSGRACGVQVQSELATPSFLQAFAGGYGVNIGGTLELLSPDYAGYNPASVLLWEDLAWEKAVRHPELPSTMYCQTRVWTEQDQNFCNPRLDARRQAIAAQVDDVFRGLHGVGLPVVPRGEGVAWQSFVASGRVGLFSLLWASQARRESDVLLRRLLGREACKTESAQFLNDRICVEPSMNPGKEFEALHPWLGGDFNPLLQGGLDTCPLPTEGSSAGVSLCPCACQPSWACNHTTELDFPDKSECGQEQYTTTRTLQASDPSNLCAWAAAERLPKYCTHPQGLALGNPAVPTGRAASPRDTIKGETLYYAAGVPLTAENHAVQGLYDAANALWCGSVAQTLPGSPDYGFLRVDRDGLPHPAHVAFGLDTESTATPMVVKGLRLLPGFAPGFTPDRVNVDWVAKLRTTWARELLELVGPLYPQLLRQPGDPAPAADWSCPLREVLFWGGGRSAFAPLKPNPVVAARLFGLGGVHPLIAPVSLAPDLATYTTSNGACFFDALSPAKAQHDSDHCSLLGTLRWLGNAVLAPSRVVHPFASRCGAFVDTPVLGAQLRSNETLVGSGAEACGVLHRLSPFLMRVRGDAGRIRRIGTGFTHTTKGGDCFMGRAFRAQRSGDMLGARCALADNSLRCASTDPDNAAQGATNLTRVRPLTLAELLARARQRRRVYRSGAGLPRFLGPGGVPLDVPEVSFGRLYAPTTMQAVAVDLLATCASTPGCAAAAAWPTATFWDDLVSGRLASSSSSSSAARLVDLFASHSSAAADARAAARERSAAAWSRPWAWSFDDHKRAPEGVVNETRWRADRWATCNASLAEYVKGRDLSQSVHDIKLCEATFGLQTLCQKLEAFKTQDTFAVNCEHEGKGDCPVNLGFFYVPSMFYAQNNEYASRTVAAYYQWAVERVGSQWSEVCPQLSGLDAQQERLRLLQAKTCPANQLEGLKTLINAVQRVGTKLMDFAYQYISIMADFFALFLVKSPTEQMVIGDDLQRHIVTLIGEIGQILPMLLDVVMRVFMQIGTVGPILRTILNGLCEAYNWVVEHIVATIWCWWTKPLVVETMRIIYELVKLVTFGNNAIPDLLKGFMEVVSGYGNGVGQTCYDDLSSDKHRAKCNYGDDGFNLTSTTGVSPLATMCWARSTSANSLLTCTQADTCATEPLNFAAGLDAAGNSNLDSTGQFALKPCAQCELLDPSLDVRPFDCDIYLKRCACGVQTKKMGACITSADCTAVGPECALSSDAADARDAFATVPCTLCFDKGKSPVCIFDGRADTGVCGCVQTWGGLQRCSADNVGRSVHVFDSLGMCAAVTDAATRGHLTYASAAPGANKWPFVNAMAVAPCSLGAQAMCLSVQLPFSSTVTLPENLVVLLDLQGVALSFGLGLGGGRRRLLQATTPAQFEHVAGLLEPPPHLDRAAAKRQLSSNVALAVAAMRCNLTSPLPWLSHPIFLVSHLETFTQLWQCAWPSAPPLATQAPGGSRRLLQQQQQQQPAAQQEDNHCMVYDVAARQLVDAFTMTAAYYAQGRGNMTLRTEPYAWPPASTKLPAGVLPWVADEAVLLASMGRVGGHQLLDALVVSNLSYDASVRLNYMTGRRLLQEVGSCNFSRLLEVAPPEGGSAASTLFYVLLLCAAVQWVFALPACLSLPLWGGVFPALLFWSLYSVSPLCWPMVPLQFPADIVRAVEDTLRPFSGQPLPLLLRPNCTSPKAPNCVLTCQDPPFLMTSGLDVAAWWLCEWSTDTCSAAARTLSKSLGWAGLGNFVSSATYYADVLRYSSKYGDTDLSGVHRWCALLASHRLLLDFCIMALLLMVGPAVILTLVDITVAFISFLWDTA